MQKSNQNRKWVSSLCHVVPTWIRQSCLSHYRDLLCLQRKDHQIPVSFQHIFYKTRHCLKIETDLLGRTGNFGFYSRFMCLRGSFCCHDSVPSCKCKSLQDSSLFLQVQKKTFSLFWFRHHTYLMSVLYVVFFLRLSLTLFLNFLKDFICLFLFFKIFYLLIFRERGKEGERERNITVWLPLKRPLTGDLACNPGMCPDQELNQRPFGLQAGTQSTEPHQPEYLLTSREGGRERQREGEKH